jgi:hypothetical protein
LFFPSLTIFSYIYFDIFPKGILLPEFLAAAFAMPKSFNINSAANPPS